LKNKQPPTIIGISGGSGSGKTHIAKRLTKRYQKGFVNLICQDSFYKDLSHLTLEQRAEKNFDNPEAIDFELLIQVIKTLSLGDPVQIPIYDFTKHIRTNNFIDLKPCPIIVLDGTLIYTQPKLLELIDLKLFIDASDKLRLSRRIKRDTSERGRTPNSIMTQYSKSVRPMFNRFVAQQLNMLILSLIPKKMKLILLI
tara:strand:- start:356 stop:949 length:594 start_codon:yes stop_codon:yes gene_type:complete